MSETPPPNGFTQEYYAEIGHYVVVWSHLEQFLKYVVLHLIGAEPKTGLLIINDMQAVKLMEYCRGLAHDYDMPDHDRVELLAWLDELEMVRRDRNRLMHATWVSGWNGSGWVPAQASVKVKTRKNATPTTTEAGIVTLRELRVKTMRAAACQSRFGALSDIVKGPWFGHTRDA